MKKFMLISGCAALIISMSGCSIVKKAYRSSMKLPVYTSFYAMYDFATKIGGTKVKVTDVTPSTQNPHTYQPKADRIKKMQKSDMFIYHDDMSEPWLTQALKGVDKKKATLIQANHGLSVRSNDKGIDPHVWLSIKNAKQELTNIYHGFVSMDSINEEYYNKRFDKYKAQLETLDHDYERQLAPYKGMSIVVTHDAYRYLCEDYGLSQLCLEGADAIKTQEIIAYMNENHIKSVFYDDFSKASDLEHIVAQTGAKAVKLHTLEGRTKKEKEAKKGYDFFMKDNLKKMKASFSTAE